MGTPSTQFGDAVISEINNSLQAMGLVQYLLVLLFLMSYPLALTEFAGPRGRSYAVVTTIVAAVAFVWFTDPWEHGVLLVAVAVLAMGAFGGTVWLLYAVLERLQLSSVPRAAGVAQVLDAGQVPLVTALQDSQDTAAVQHKTSPSGVLPIA